MTVAFDSENWRLIDGTTWVAVLNALNEQSRLLDGEFDFQNFIRSLGEDPPRGAFADLIETLQDLSTDDARELLAQAACDRNVEIDLSDDIAILELVARLWLQSKSEPSGQKIVEILMLARIGISNQVDSNRRKYREFIGDRPLQAQLDKGAIEVAIREWCKQRKKDHESIKVLGYPRGAGYCYEILRGDPLKRVTEIRDNRASILSYKPARTDHIRYEPASGRIGIATRASSLFEVYKSLLGTILADSEKFFSGGSVCTLFPLLQADSAVFKEFLGTEVQRVDVKRIVWRRGLSDRVVVQGADCFKLLTDLSVRLTEGAITEAVLSISLANRRRPAKVEIKVPDVIDIQGAGAQEDAIRNFLSAVGIRTARHTEELPTDLWSLYPHVLSEPKWRKILVGPNFDSLLRHQLLEPVNILPAVTHPDFPRHANALSVVPIGSTSTMLGISADSAIPLRTLSPTDTLGYRVNWLLQGQLIAKALELSGSPTEIEPGLWQLGQRSFHSAAEMTVFLAARSPLSHWGSLLRQFSGMTTPLLLVPSACSSDIAHTVKMPLPSPVTDGLLERCILCLNWADKVPKHLWMAADLIICEATQRMWYRGTQLSALPAGGQPYKFALAVAQGDGRIVATATLATILSPGRGDIKDVAKQAKSDFLAAAKSSFKAACKDHPEAEIKTLFEAKRGMGYVLTGTARIIGGSK